MTAGIKNHNYHLSLHHFTLSPETTQKSPHCLSRTIRADTDHVFLTSCHLLTFTSTLSIFFLPDSIIPNTKSLFFLSEPSQGNQERKLIPGITLNQNMAHQRRERDESFLGMWVIVIPVVVSMRPNDGQTLLFFTFNSLSSFLKISCLRR